MSDAFDILKQFDDFTRKGSESIVRPASLKKFGVKFFYTDYKFFQIKTLYSKKLGLTEARILHDWLTRYIRFREKFR